MRRLGHLAGIGALAAVTGLVAYQRIAYFALGRGLWRDEAALVQSVAAMGFGRLTGQLYDQQSAPVLFLWATKAVMVLAGDSERWLRTLPLAAGLLVLPLTIVAARHAAGPGARVSWFGVCLPVGATMFTAQIVFYCAQVKPYTVDMATVAGLLVLAQLLVERGCFDPLARWWRVGFVLAAVVTPWLSVGAMLCVGPITAWLVVVGLRRDPDQRRRARHHWRWWAGLALAGVSDLASAGWAVHLTAAVPQFGQYWARWLNPLTRGQGFSLGAGWRWHVFLLRDFLQQDLGSSHPYLLAPVLLAGWLCVLRRDRAVAVLLLLPIGTAYAAALAGEYPFARRLVLFVLPGLLVGLGALFDGVVRALGGLVARARLPGRARHPDATGRACLVGAGGASWWRTAACGLVVATLAAASTSTLVAGPRSLHIGLTYVFGVDDYQPALQFVAAKRDPTDVIVVAVPDRVVARLEAEKLGIPTDSFAVAVLPGHPASAPEQTSCPLPRRLRTAHSIWIVTSNMAPLDGTLSRVWLRQPLLTTHYVAYLAVLRYVSVLRLLPATHGSHIDTPCPVYRELGPPGSIPTNQPELP